MLQKPEAFATTVPEGKNLAEWLTISAILDSWIDITGSGCYEEDDGESKDDDTIDIWNSEERRKSRMKKSEEIKKAERDEKVADAAKAEMDEKGKRRSERDKDRGDGRNHRDTRRYAQGGSRRADDSKRMDDGDPKKDHRRQSHRSPKISHGNSTRPAERTKDETDKRRDRKPESQSRGVSRGNDQKRKPEIETNNVAKPETPSDISRNPHTRDVPRRETPYDESRNNDKLRLREMTVENGQTKEKEIQHRHNTTSFTTNVHVDSQGSKSLKRPSDMSGAKEKTRDTSDHPPRHRKDTDVRPSELQRSPTGTESRQQSAKTNSESETMTRSESHKPAKESSRERASERRTRVLENSQHMASDASPSKSSSSYHPHRRIESWSHRDSENSRHKSSHSSPSKSSRDYRPYIKQEYQSLRDFENSKHKAPDSPPAKTPSSYRPYSPKKYRPLKDLQNSQNKASDSSPAKTPSSHHPHTRTEYQPQNITPERPDPISKDTTAHRAPEQHRKKEHEISPDKISARRSSLQTRTRPATMTEIELTSHQSAKSRREEQASGQKDRYSKRPQTELSVRPVEPNDSSRARTSKRSESRHAMTRVQQLKSENSSRKHRDRNWARSPADASDAAVPTISTRTHTNTTSQPVSQPITTGRPESRNETLTAKKAHEDDRKGSQSSKAKEPPYSESKSSLTRTATTTQDITSRLVTARRPELRGETPTAKETIKGERKDPKSSPTKESSSIEFESNRTLTTTRTENTASSNITASLSKLSSEDTILKPPMEQKDQDSVRSPTEVPASSPAESRQIRPSGIEESPSQPAFSTSQAPTTPAHAATTDQTLERKLKQMEELRKEAAHYSAVAENRAEKQTAHKGRVCCLHGKPCSCEFYSIHNSVMAGKNAEKAQDIRNPGPESYAKLPDVLTVGVDANGKGPNARAFTENYIQTTPPVLNEGHPALIVPPEGDQIFPAVLRAGMDADGIGATVAVLMQQDIQPTPPVLDEVHPAIIFAADSEDKGPIVPEYNRDSYVPPAPSIYEIHPAFRNDTKNKAEESKKQSIEHRDTVESYREESYYEYSDIDDPDYEYSDSDELDGEDDDQSTPRSRSPAYPPPNKPLPPIPTASSGTRDRSRHPKSTQPARNNIRQPSKLRRVRASANLRATTSNNPESVPGASSITMRTNRQGVASITKHVVIKETTYYTVEPPVRGRSLGKTTVTHTEEGTLRQAYLPPDRRHGLRERVITTPHVKYVSASSKVSREPIPVDTSELRSAARALHYLSMPAAGTGPSPVATTMDSLHLTNSHASSSYIHAVPRTYRHTKEIPTTLLNLDPDDPSNRFYSKALNAYLPFPTEVPDDVEQQRPGTREMIANQAKRFVSMIRRKKKGISKDTIGMPRGGEEVVDSWRLSVLERRRQSRTRR
jgi:hypothetical protein